MLSVEKKEDLLKSHNNLSVLYKRILQLRAILFDIEYKTNFFKFIFNYDLKNANGALFPIHHLSKMFDELIAYVHALDKARHDDMQKLILNF